MMRRPVVNGWVAGVSAIAALAVSVSFSAQVRAQSVPAVKVKAANKVPECATPGRMMAFIGARNKKLNPRYDGIATHYMRHGEQLGIRWDYAFFQMMLETGNLAYQRGNGKPGDVKPSQNNFAGLGATGKGAPGESFKTIEDGVRAHLQHLMMYAGERIEDPVAERTRDVQQWGILTSWQKGFKRPITFADVAGKWAPGSRGYVRDVKSIAESFYEEHCSKPDPRPHLVKEARAGRGAVGTRIARPAQPRAEAAGGDAKPATPGAELARQALERARAEGEGTRSGLGASGALTAAPSKTQPGTAAGGPSFRVLNDPPKEEAASAEAPAAQAAEPAQTVQQAAVQQAAVQQAAVQQAAVASGGAKPPASAAANAAAPATQIAALPKPPAAPAAPAPAATKCRVFTASYGGQKAVIIKASAESFTNFTVLDVNEGQEGREVEAYIAAYAKGGQKVGQFASSNAALEEAFKLCPEG